MNLAKKNKGFTIIEVVIVLAIAGLIFAIVFWALPNLQKNQRDGTRRQVLGNVLANVDQFAANNNGGYPDATVAGDWNKFTEAFYSCTIVAGSQMDDLSASEACTLEDPLEGVFIADDIDGANTTEPVVGELFLNTAAKCDPDNIGQTEDAGDRSLAILAGLENGVAYCLDNS